MYLGCRTIATYRCMLNAFENVQCNPHTSSKRQKASFTVRQYFGSTKVVSAQNRCESDVVLEYLVRQIARISVTVKLCSLHKLHCE